MYKSQHIKFIIWTILFIFTVSNSSIVYGTGWPEDPSKITIDTTNDDDVTIEFKSLNNPIDIERSEITRIDDNVSDIDNKPIFDPESKIIDDSDEARRIYASYSDTIPNVTIDDGINWVNRKGFEIIRFLQVIVQPLTIIVFIISALYMLFGSIGRGDLAGRGTWGMIISAIVYGIVLYAPVILQSFVGWIAS